MLENFQNLLIDLWQIASRMGLVIIVLWILFTIDKISGRTLTILFCIQPRLGLNPARLFVAPLLHFNLAHILGNTLPLFVLGSLVMVHGMFIFTLTSLGVILISGMGAWVLGQSRTCHVGASGVILGYFGFILANVYFAPDVATIILAVIVGLLYLGLIWQIVPLDEGISFTLHFFGFLGGIAMAWLLAVN